MNLSQISRTALSTLTSRTVAAEKSAAEKPAAAQSAAAKQTAVFYDPMAALCWERLLALASAEERAWMLRQRRLYAGWQAHHAHALARRVAMFDRAAELFITHNPGGMVVNLACGFDTRFWRLGLPGERYVEVDLPEVVALKRAILKDQLCYDLIGCSILDSAWMDQVAAHSHRQVLLLAEGVCMYLPEPAVRQLLQRLAQRFEQSQLVVDVMPEKYTRGLWKQLIALESRYTWGLETAYVFGLDRPRDLEAYAPGLNVLGEASRAGALGSIVTLSINAA